MEKKNVEDVIKDIDESLTNDEVLERKKNGRTNEGVKSATKSIRSIIKENVCTYFNLIFFILSILLVSVGAYRDLLFLGVILANTSIGIIQEIHAKRVLDRLTILTEPRAKVVRNGKVEEVLSEELVQDDLLLLEAGNQIPADAVMTSGFLTVNEALLTGEAEEIKKAKGDTLLSGSFVVSGEGKAKLTKVGKDSYIANLTLLATKSKEGEQSEMIRSLNYLIIFMGILILPIGIALFTQSYFFHKASLHDSITGMVAAVIGMIPEGLYLLSSVALAVSTGRLAKQKVLVHDMKCVETLARVDVLCVDKTGTITDADMFVDSFFVADDKISQSHTKELLCALSQNMPKDNQTMLAMQNYFSDKTSSMVNDIISFSSKTKYSGAKIDGINYILGAPEIILKDQIDEYHNFLQTHANQGFRVLAFAEGNENHVIPLAFILLTNSIRKGAKETFSFFAEHDVDIKVISGDHPITVSAIASQAGIQNADCYIDANSLKTERDYDDAVLKYTVFGRVTPEQKKELVMAFKRLKKTVAMTGDGVNDVLALKAADCSVAMACGSDAAANVSQLVLLDSDFSRMPSVVKEGRRVVNNIERTAALYIVKNIFSMLLAIFSVILVWNYPLVPTQISLISFFTIGLPSFVLALEPNENKISGHFLINILIKALPAGITDFLVVSGLVWFCREFELKLDCLSTSCTVLIAIVGFMILYRIAKPMKRLHISMMIALVAGLLFCMIYVSDFFAITYITKQNAMLLFIFAMLAEPAFRYLEKVTEFINKRWGR